MERGMENAHKRGITLRYDPVPCAEFVDGELLREDAGVEEDLQPCFPLAVSI